MVTERYSRQSFLGATSQEKISTARVGVIGLGGGGSHIVQQLAHVGFQHYVLYDADIPEESNLNRLIGATIQDVADKRPKLESSIRVIQGLQPDAIIEGYQKRWQKHPVPLRSCDVIFGCVDGFAERRELEICARRYHIPYVDIGIDVHQVESEPPVMSGQIIASIPSGPCLTCIGFLTEEKLAREAMKYGAAGKHPQVVWGNGVVASTAVGVGIDILTGWTRKERNTFYLLYEGNTGTLKQHPRLDQLQDWQCCPHYPNELVGDPQLKTL